MGSDKVMGGRRDSPAPASLHPQPPISQDRLKNVLAVPRPLTWRPRERTRRRFFPLKIKQSMHESPWSLEEPGGAWRRDGERGRGPASSGEAWAAE